MPVAEAETFQLSQRAKRQIRIAQFPFKEAASHYVLSSTAQLAIVLSGSKEFLEDRLEGSSERDLRKALSVSEDVYYRRSEFIVSGIYNGVKHHARSTSYENTVNNALDRTTDISLVAARRKARIARYPLDEEAAHYLSSVSAELAAVLAGGNSSVESRLNNDMFDLRDALTPDELKLMPLSEYVVSGIFDAVMHEHSQDNYRNSYSLALSEEMH